MESIRGLLDDSTLQSIAKAAGKGVTEKQVEDVLNAVLPAIEKDNASGTLVTRTNAAVAEQQAVTRSGGTRAGGLDLLSLLLGGNTSTATQTAATNAHVSNGQASSILKIAAPILLFLLLKNKLGGSSNSGGGLLGSLLGGGSSNGSLLGSLLGGGSAQPVQQQSSANDSLLGMLLGGGNDADTSAGSSQAGMSVHRFSTDLPRASRRDSAASPAATTSPTGHTDAAVPGPCITTAAPVLIQPGLHIDHLLQALLPSNKVKRIPT